MVFVGNGHNLPKIKRPAILRIVQSLDKETIWSGFSSIAVVTDPQLIHAGCLERYSHGGRARAGLVVRLEDERPARVVKPDVRVQSIRGADSDSDHVPSIDGLVKVVTPVKTGVQVFCKAMNKLDSGFRRND